MSGKSSKLELCYSPRAMRVDQAAAYLGMSRASFLRLVEDEVLPKRVRITGGMVVWDRLELDAAFDAMKDRGNGQQPSGNTMHKILGIVHEDEHG